MIQVLGRFLLFVYGAFRSVESFRIAFANFIDECIKAGFNSLFIVVIISLFTGAVSTIQTVFNLDEPYILDYYAALVVRDTIFSLMPTLIAFVYAGKVGSNMSGELGTMRITEQIDALEIMGINARSYLVMPKILASVIMFPALVIIGCFMAVFGGYLIAELLDVITATDYIRGIRVSFNEFVITIILVKSIAFGFLVPVISSFHGFYVSGGAREVGQASTNAVVRSCIAIIIAEYLLTQLIVA